GRRSQPQEPSVVPVLKYPDRAVAVLLDGADTLAVQADPFRFARTLLIDLDPDQRLGRQAGNERIPLPLRERLAGIDKQAGRGNHRRPVQYRGNEFRAGVVVRDRAAVVVVAIRYQGVAVIASAFDQVELVAPLRAHLDFPQAAFGIEV